MNLMRQYHAVSAHSAMMLRLVPTKEIAILPLTKGKQMLNRWNNNCRLFGNKTNEKKKSAKTDYQQKRIQLNNPIIDFKGPINFICCKRNSTIPNTVKPRLSAPALEGNLS